MKEKRDRIVSALIDVIGYSEEDLNGMSYEELLDMVHEMTEENKTDIAAYLA